MSSIVTTPFEVEALITGNYSGFKRTGLKVDLVIKVFQWRPKSTREAKQTR